MGLTCRRWNLVNWYSHLMAHLTSWTSNLWRCSYCGHHFHHHEWKQMGSLADLHCWIGEELTHQNQSWRENWTLPLIQCPWDHRFPSPSCSQDLMQTLMNYFLLTLPMRETFHTPQWFSLFRHLLLGFHSSCRRTCGRDYLRSDFLFLLLLG